MQQEQQQLDQVNNAPTSLNLMKRHSSESCRRQTSLINASWSELLRHRQKRGGSAARWLLLSPIFSVGFELREDRGRWEVSIWFPLSPTGHLSDEFFFSLSLSLALYPSDPTSLRGGSVVREKETWWRRGRSSINKASNGAVVAWFLSGPTPRRVTGQPQSPQTAAAGRLRQLGAVYDWQ